MLCSQTKDCIFIYFDITAEIMIFYYEIPI